VVRRRRRVVSYLDLQVEVWQRPIFFCRLKIKIFQERKEFCINSKQ
jgi:hypothetical protein